MTAVPDYDTFRNGAAIQPGMGAAPHFSIEETYWGYIIHSGERVPVWLIATQAASWLMGVLFAIAAVGIWALPGADIAEDMLGFRLGATIPLAGVAVLLFWYSSRGTRIEVQIDTTRGEVREMLCNRAGRTMLLGLYGFDAIGGVFLERGDTRWSGQAQLVLRYRNTAQVLRVARGSETMLEKLRDRLGSDLMVRQKSGAGRSQSEREALSSAA